MNAAETLQNIITLATNALAQLSASRFYFSTVAADPVLTGAGWEDTTTGKIVRSLTPVKSPPSSEWGSSGSVANKNVLILQAVSAPLAAQTISGTVKAQMIARDTDMDNSVYPRFAIHVCSGDGQTLRGTLLSVGDYGPGTKLSTQSNRNKAFANGDTLTSVAAQAGDLLVVEFGVRTSTGALAQLDFGMPSATDLPEDETTVSPLTSWVEFSNPVAFQCEC